MIRKNKLIKQELSIRSDEGRWGCLTTGDRWDFYYLRKRTGKTADGENIITGYDYFELTDVKANSEEGSSKVIGTVCEEVFNWRVGILTHIVGQCRPSVSDAVTLDEDEDDAMEWGGINNWVFSTFIFFFFCFFFVSFSFSISILIFLRVYSGMQGLYVYWMVTGGLIISVFLTIELKWSHLEECSIRNHGVLEIQKASFLNLCKDCV